MSKLNQTGVVTHLLLIIILLIGLVVTVYLVRHPQIFKSKASQAPILDALSITDPQGSPVPCDGNTNPPTCNISEPDIYLQIKNADVLATSP